jgi:DNA-binding FadR family transcriptional regulator
VYPLQVMWFARSLSTALPQLAGTQWLWAHRSHVRLRDLRYSPRRHRALEAAAEYVVIRNIRIELEGLALEHAARNATADDIGNLEKLLNEGERAIKKRDHAASRPRIRPFTRNSP